MQSIGVEDGWLDGTSGSCSATLSVAVPPPHAQHAILAVNP
jgi:hypothetical protein